MNILPKKKSSLLNLGSWTLTLVLILVLWTLNLALPSSALAATADCNNYQQYGFKDKASCDDAVLSCAIAEYLSLFPDQLACVQFFGSLDALFANQVDGPWYNQNPTQFATKVTGGDQNEIFGERYTFAQINWIVNSISTMINPASGIENPLQLLEFFNSIQKALGIAQSGHVPSMADYSKLGPIGLFASSFSSLYSHPPASGIGEVKRLAGRLFDIGTGVQPAYAQGYGFRGLGGNDTNSAVRALWTATRNMAYLIMVILLVASGFLIMFRVKINPQTVVSLQTMIPKLIITLLLVTFSFAIAGLVIDLVYVLISAFVGFMSMAGVMDRPDQIASVIGQLTSGSFWTYFGLQASNWIFGLIFALFVSAILFVLFPGVGLLGVLVGLIIFVWIIYIFIKIFIMLVKAYVLLILQIMIAPLQIMLDLIPGQQGFGPWLRNLIANASVFVVVPIMMFLQYTISWSLFANNALHVKNFGDTGEISLILPYVKFSDGYVNNALGSWNAITPIIIGMFIFSLTPKIADMIRDMLKIPAFKYGTAFGEAMKPFTMVTKTGAGMGVRTAAEEFSGAITQQMANATPWRAGLKKGAQQAGETLQKVIQSG